MQRRFLESVLALVVAIAGIIIFVPQDLDAAIRDSNERELPVHGVEVLTEQVPDGRIRRGTDGAAT